MTTRHVTDWTIRVRIVEEDGQTHARARLEGDGRALFCYGDARLNPTDFEVPEIGEELAVGRALVGLGTRLIEATAKDIEQIEGRPIFVSP
ncbi:MAG: DUF1876 domain-containing protein [Catenulispora sp.]|nr:DUF1876 domain-containing protein [Catenulispora sp.]